MTASHSTAALLLAATFVIAPAQAENLQFSINLIINDQEVTSIGRAEYTPPSLCLQCAHWGNHRINGGSASYSWSLTPVDIYERQLSDWVSDRGCYRGFIEGWGTGGFYGSQQTIEKCAPCVLWTEASGSGSVAGAPIGQSSYNCGTGITLTAEPAAGWRFVQWGGSISSTSTTISFTLDASKSMTAFFEQVPYDDDRDGGDAEGYELDVEPNNPSPILVDMDRDGYHLVGAAAGVRFDLDADGVAEQAGWTRAGALDAFLVLDRNGNGIIDDGRELFGTATPLHDGTTGRHGYVALAEFDHPTFGGNGDGLITQGDAIWPALALWADLDHSGTSEPGEIRPVPQSELESIDLNFHRAWRRDPHGNVFRYRSLATLRLNGQAAYVTQTYDVFFVVAR